MPISSAPSSNSNHAQGAEFWRAHADLENADVLVVRKRSGRERYGANGEKFEEAHSALMRGLDCLEKTFCRLGLRAHFLTLNELQNSPLRYFHPKRGLNARGVQPKRGLVLSLGGDGTLLHASHYVGGDTQLLGINTSPQSSVGHLCAATLSSLEYTLDEVLNNQRPPHVVQRLGVSSVPPPVSGHEAEDHLTALPLALNDILFCHEHPAASSKYALRIVKQNQNQATHADHAQGVEEEQTSSGIWLSTAAGSTAAISTYGLPRLHPESKKFLLAVRELYQKVGSMSVLDRQSFIGGIHTIAITSHMSRGLIAVDGADFTSEIRRGETMLISMEPEMALLLHL